MNPSQKQAIEAKAEELYPPESWTQYHRNYWIEGATFGLSLQTNEWVKCSDRLPTNEDADEYGNVLIYRQTNEGQKSLSKSIYDYNMVRFCDKENTHWMPLPTSPNK